MCCHAEVVASLKVLLAFFGSTYKKKYYCFLEGSSQWADFLVIETSTDHAAFIYLVVAGLVVV